MIVFYCKKCKKIIYYVDVIVDKKTDEIYCPICAEKVEETSDY